MDDTIKCSRSANRWVKHRFSPGIRLFWRNVCIRRNRGMRTRDSDAEPLKQGVSDYLKESPSSLPVNPRAGKQQVHPFRLRFR